MEEVDNNFIYFAANISGNEYSYMLRPLVQHLRHYGTVLSDHATRVGPLGGAPGHHYKDHRGIYNYDINLLDKATILVAEVSRPSLGVGYEIGYAEHRKIPILALAEHNVSISAMIQGSPHAQVIRYHNLEDAAQKIHEYFEKL